MGPKTDSPLRKELVKGLWKENPVLVAALGLCPTLAVDELPPKRVGDGGRDRRSADRFVVPGRAPAEADSEADPDHRLHHRDRDLRDGRVDLALAAYLPDAHKALGAFIALIVVNCIILGRQEAFAGKNPVGLSVADAVGMSGGLTIAMVLISTVREILASATLLGVRVFGDWFEPWVIMILPPGGFLVMGALLAIVAYQQERATKRRAA